MTRWWKPDEPTPPPCANCRHGAEYHTPNMYDVLVCLELVNGTMSCLCHEAGGYVPSKLKQPAPPRQSRKKEKP